MDAPTPGTVRREPPGRRLDAWVAYHVFGWRWFRSLRRGLCTLQPPEGGGWTRSPWAGGDGLFGEVAGWPADAELFSDWDRGGRRGPPVPASGVPPFSTDVVAAWAVIERLIEQDRVRVILSASHWGHDRCSVTAADPPRDADPDRRPAAALVRRDVYAVAGRGMPHAVCVATLLAVIPDHDDGGGQ
jgi:hypothetical protein